MVSNPMKFVFKNLGPITEAKLELGDFTIISGRNNTGKTYIAHALYGFMRKFKDVVLSDYLGEFFDSHFQEMASMPAHEIGDHLTFNDHIEWKVDVSVLAEQQSRLIQKVSQEFSKNELHSVFAAHPTFFEGVSLEADFEVELHSDVSVLTELIEDKELYLRYDGSSVGIELRDSSFESDDEGEDDPDEGFYVSERDVKEMYSYLLLRDVFESHFIPTIFSSARHAIPLFIDELDYVRSQWIRRWMQERRGDKRVELSMGQEFPKGISSYALPIHDNIDFFRRIRRWAERRENRPQGGFSTDVEKMVGGSFSSTDGELRFTASDRGESSFDIPLFLASSSAWEMSGLYFHLGYFASKDRSHFLIIDEPESHLDTANQILLTRLLARLVNSGTKVLITTHSDYIVREINNLIMLTSPLEGGDEAKRAMGYGKDDELRQNQVRAYVAQDGTLRECRKDKYGIEMPVFDETIDELNDRSEDLASRIMMKGSKK